DQLAEVLYFGFGYRSWFPSEIHDGADPWRPQIRDAAAGVFETSKDVSWKERKVEDLCTIRPLAPFLIRRQEPLKTFFAQVDRNREFVLRLYDQSIPGLNELNVEQFSACQEQRDR